jgi:hypothetical protein
VDRVELEERHVERARKLAAEGRLATATRSCDHGNSLHTRIF